MIRLLLVFASVVVAAGAPTVADAQTPNVFQDCGEAVPSIRFSASTQTETGVIYRGIPQDPVVVSCGDTRLTADEIEVNYAESMIHARGNVLIEQPDMRVTAARADLHRQTRFGTLYEAGGFLQIADRGLDQGMFGTQAADIEFYAERIEKIGPRTFRLTNASFTACAQPTPRWQFTASSGVLTVGKHMLLKNAVFRVKNVPLFYIPAIYYPLTESGRATGFLMPGYGTSTIRGASISNAFFWAMSRNQDATFFHDWFSRAGQGVGGEYRFVSAPGSEGNVRVYMLDRKEQLSTDGVSVVQPAGRSFDVRGHVNQAMPRGFRLVGRVNYFSDITTQQTFQQDLFDLSQRQRDVSLTLLGQVGRYRISVAAQQRDVFYGTDIAQRNGRMPRLNVTLADKPVGRSLIYLGGFVDATYLVRQDDLNDPDTNHSLWRFDAQPRVRMPISKLSFLTATTSASWRITQWLESRDLETGLQEAVPMTRHLLDVRVDAVGPVFTRVFQTPESGYAERYKHVIEPFVSFQWLSPFAGRDRVVQIDGVDTLVGGTAQVSYGITNRLLARRARGVRDILTVGIRQTYYTDLLAAAFDPEYASATASPFSPVRINVDLRPADGLIARFTTDIDAEFKKPRTYNASATVRRTWGDVTASWTKRNTIPGLPGFDDPANASHFLNGSTTLRTADNTTGGTYAFNYDVLNGTMVQQRVMAYYNAQCCGISIDYQTVSVANFGFIQIPADRRFGISFSLAGIGSFANPLGSFGR
jgi:LPS-assembly protein